jgi:hypothetical protein
MEDKMLAKCHFDIAQKLGKVAEKVEYANSGGCAIIALRAYKYIQQHHPKVSPKLVYLYSKGELDDVEKINNNIPVSCSHAVIKIGRYYYDSDTVRTKKELQARYGYVVEVSPDIVAKSIRKKHQWNPRFNRKTEVKKVNNIFSLKYGLM